MIDGANVRFLAKVGLQFSRVENARILKCNIICTVTSKCRLHVSSRMALRKRWVSEDKIKLFEMTTDCDSARVYRMHVFSVHVPLRMAIFLSCCFHVCSKLISKKVLYVCLTVPTDSTLRCV